MGERSERLAALLDRLNSRRQEWEIFRPDTIVTSRDLNFLAGIVQATLHELVYGDPPREAGGDE